MFMQKCLRKNVYAKMFTRKCSGHVRTFLLRKKGFGLPHIYGFPNPFFVPVTLFFLMAMKNPVISCRLSNTLFLPLRPQEDFFLRPQG